MLASKSIFELGFGNDKFFGFGVEMLEDFDSLIEELCNPLEMDSLYQVGLLKTHKLQIFRGEAFSFYIGVVRVSELCAAFSKKFEKFNILYEEENQRRLKYNFSFEENSKFENKWISILSRLEKQKHYLNLTLLFQYSLILESAINCDQVMKDHPEKKEDYLKLGMAYKSTKSTWIELISYASNFSRHYSEWRVILNSAFKQDGDIEEKISKVIKDKIRRKNLIALMELPSVYECFSADLMTWQISDAIIKELDLLNFERSFKRIMMWLLRLEIKWADQFTPNKDFYLKILD